LWNIRPSQEHFSEDFSGIKSDGNSIYSFVMPAFQSIVNTAFADIFKMTDDLSDYVALLDVYHKVCNHMSGNKVSCNRVV